MIPEPYSGRCDSREPGKQSYQEWKREGPRSSLQVQEEPFLPQGSGKVSLGERSSLEFQRTIVVRVREGKSRLESVDRVGEKTVREPSLGTSQVLTFTHFQLFAAPVRWRSRLSNHL